MKRKMKRPTTSRLGRRERPLEELKAIIARTQEGPLPAADREKLEGAVDTLAVLTLELEQKGTSIRRLRQMLFGASTEKTSTLFGGEEAADGQQPRDGETPAPAAGEAAPADGSEPARQEETSRGSEKPKRKVRGHGRNGASDYPGAERVPVPHPTLARGQVCPECEKGKVYPLQEPAVLVRIVGMAPFAAKRFECERVRCNLCGKVFTAPPPDGVGTAKYDESVPAMIGLLKYGTGLPWNRLEHLQAWLGVPMPASTQWELVRDAERDLAPVCDELVRQAAQGKVLHNDDTTAKVLELMGGAKPFGCRSSGVMLLSPWMAPRCASPARRKRVARASQAKARVTCIEAAGAAPWPRPLPSSGHGLPR
jgi:transposase